MSAPYDWQTETDRARFLRAVAVWVAYLGALTLTPIGLWYLTVGQPIGLVVWALAATIWATARAVDRFEAECHKFGCHDTEPGEEQP